MTAETRLPAPLVETAWLAEHLKDPGLRILDCSVVMNHRDDGSYFFSSGRENWEKEHIPGSQFVDVLDELSDPNHAVRLMMPPVEDFAKAMADHGVGEGTRVVLYDALNHAWAARVWWMLRVCGFDDAAVLNGGWKKWLAENRETSTAAVTYPRGKFTAKPRHQLMVTKEEVLKSLHNRDVSLINALSPEMHNGKVVLFPRPGRIPGSKNVFCQLLVDPVTQAYIKPEAMRDLFKPTGALDTERVITYCGGGIAASSDALALTLLGVKNVAVYDGSMSEWTADPALPLETE